ncbi:MAG: hypothetical protein JG777_1755 [Clostridia bacterium]|nr:hypothetical protein [Clostridia bacterium]
MDQNIFLKRLFFKKRFVFVLNTTERKSLQLEDNIQQISFEFTSKKNYGTLIQLCTPYESDFYLKSLKKRLESPDIWKGIIAFLDDKPVGCHWILLPQEKNVKHDGFKITKNSALFCGVFVHPDYRGRRIYNSMHKFVYNLWINEFYTRDVFTIVEEKNKASLKSNSRIGLKIKGYNYLLKFCGLTILSIYAPLEGKLQIWCINPISSFREKILRK